ncbi:DUF533 domain-containing protein [Actibacterium ureilyticum]|uniref:DUF533 domain-containing protein n=1 Tax=Actibacterium ureilyticum TaxID=1590614 RepID=UPI000BAAFB40|nr:DUF533 domain-containing protein [Actibacterium ureilyticum]
MSFVRTLATLAAGFAAAKGLDKYKQMGGMAGLQEAMKSNPATANMAEQMDGMMEKLGIPGGTKAMQDMFSKFGMPTQAGESAMAGMGGLMSAMTGAAAAGAEQTGAFWDTLTGNKVASSSMEENAKLMIRAMIQAAKVDGEIDKDEQAKIMEMMGELDKEERDFVKKEMAAPVDITALAADTSEQMKSQVYATSLMTVKVDSAPEAQYLDGLAKALGLSDATRARVHAAMGMKA